jgi:hypothetical protein
MLLERGHARYNSIRGPGPLVLGVSTTSHDSKGFSALFPPLSSPASSGSVSNFSPVDSGTADLPTPARVGDVPTLGGGTQDGQSGLSKPTRHLLQNHRIRARALLLPRKYRFWLGAHHPRDLLFPTPNHNIVTPEACLVGARFTPQPTCQPGSLDLRVASGLPTTYAVRAAMRPKLRTAKMVRPMCGQVRCNTVFPKPASSFRLLPHNRPYRVGDLAPHHGSTEHPRRLNRICASRIQHQQASAESPVSPTKISTNKSRRFLAIESI